MHMDTGKIIDFIYCLNRSIAAFKDQGLPVIYTINEWTNPILNFLTGNVCKKGAEGTGIDSQIDIINNNVFYKSEKSVFTNKDLATYLKKESVNELYVTGLLAEFCIKSTVIDALKNQYRVVVVEDAIGSRSEKLKSKSISYLMKKGAATIKSGNLGTSNASKQLNLVSI